MHRSSLVLALLGLTASVPGAEPSRALRVAPADGGIHVHVAKRGLFSAFAHDHDFEVTRWRGAADLPGGDPARASLEVVLDAGSLREREEGLSGDDRKKVESQAAGPKVLDAARAPEITYRSDRVSVESGSGSGPVRGTIHGQLTLRGRTRPVDAKFEAQRAADGWRVRGRARFRQSAFGIEPFSGAGGTVGVKDEVEVTFDLGLRGDGAAGAAPSTAGR